MTSRAGIPWLRWYGPHLIVLALAVSVAAFYVVRSIERLHVERLITDMGNQAFLAGKMLSCPESGLLPERALQERCVELREFTGQRWTIMDMTGRVLADSDGAMERIRGDPLGLRPEVRQAIDTGRGWSKRHNVSVRENFLYVAHRHDENGRSVGIVRVAVPLAKLEERTNATRRGLLLVTAIVLLLAVAAAAWAARRNAQLLDRIRQALHQVTQGDFGSRVPPLDSNAIGGMGGDLNVLAERLQHHIEDLATERSHRDAMLSSMSEGVLAIDLERRVSWMNRAARDLLRLRGERGADSYVHEIIPHAEFLAAIDKATASDSPIESEATVSGASAPVILWVHAAPLKNAAGARLGTVLVFSDLTRLRHLERVRQDFVANVSHELKTPLTTIRGVIETLLDGSTHDPVSTARFLDMLRRHTESLDRIVSDLLLLSRVEIHAQSTLERSPITLRDQLLRAVAACSRRADERGVTIDTRCSESIRILAHPSLLEQALINLIVNAINYGPEKGVVSISVRVADNEVAIGIRDQGPGIAAHHLERIFERFYRVDKGRSREFGGTGLGLSIVRHIAAAHGGRIEVESTPGVGSLFTLRLPADEPEDRSTPKHNDTQKEQER